MRLPAAIAIVSLAAGCRGSIAAPAPPVEVEEQGCRIPCDEIHFGRRQDQVPPLEEPEAGRAEEVLDIEPDDRVIGVALGGEARAYPLRVLARHEIVNDTLGGRRIAVVHAPLTGATTVFDLDAMDARAGLGSSGGHYNADLLVYDRETGSLWSPMMRQAVVGERAGDPMTVVASLDASLAAWLESHPETTVVGTDNGHDELTYDGDPYAWYARDEERLLAPVRFLDLRLPRKEQVLGLGVGAESRAYPLEALGDRRVFADGLGGERLVVVVDQPRGVAAAYSARVEERSLGFELTGDGDVAFMRDRQTGSGWTALGLAVDGPLRGSRLEPLDASRLYWVAWAAFRRGTEIHGRRVAEGRPGQELGGGSE